MSMPSVKFSRDQQEFMRELRKRVNNYFKTNNISRYANAQMIVKTAVVVSLLFVPYFLLLFGGFTNFWAVLLLWVLMALGTSGIGLSVMHDANHGAYSRYKTVNTLLGNLIYFLGGNAVNWRIQHNVLHHSYTNIHGMDEDIDTGIILRFSPNQKRYWFHRFQHFYAWALYGMMTILWSTTKDFREVIRYHKMDLLKTQGRNLFTGFTEVLLTKILYYVFILVLPLWLVDIPWYQTLICLFVMHYIVGFLLACIFQAAHVVEETAFPVPEDGKIENNWAIHQLMTTCNFAPKSRIFSWFIGGLNYQIEHHLFPNICHVHYKKISKIVKETAKEFNLPYYSQPTFLSALMDHARMLRQLGRA